MNMLDNFPADGPTAKRAHVGSMQAPPTGRAPAFGANAERTRSYQEEAAVPSDVRSRLESVGMRTRFNVNRGYGVQFTPSTSSSSAAAAHPTHSVTRNGHLVTETDVLHHVLSTRSTWSRSASAPQWTNELEPFGGTGIRPSLLPTAAEENEGMQSINGDENEDPLAAHFGEDDDAASNTSSGRGAINPFTDLKRSRDDASADVSPSPQQQPFDASMHDKPIRTLPGPARRSGASMFGTSRINGGAATMPVSSGLTNYLAGNAVLPHSNASVHPGSDDAVWAQQNFTSFARSDNF